MFFHKNNDTMSLFQTNVCVSFPMFLHHFFRREATLSGQSGLTKFELRQVGDFNQHDSRVGVYTFSFLQSSKFISISYVIQEHKKRVTTYDLHERGKDIV